MKRQTVLLTVLLSLLVYALLWSPFSPFYRAAKLGSTPIFVIQKTQAPEPDSGLPDPETMPCPVTGETILFFGWQGGVGSFSTHAYAGETVLPGPGGVSGKYPTWVLITDVTPYSAQFSVPANSSKDPRWGIVGYDPNGEPVSVCQEGKNGKRLVAPPAKLPKNTRSA